MARIDFIRRKVAVAFSLRGLLLKAAFLAVLWRVVPFWLFLLVALWLYLSPLFRPLEMGLPFLLTLCFAGILPANFWSTAFLGTLFFLILGIKDLILVERENAYRVLLFLLFFLIFLNFFSEFNTFERSTALLSLFAIVVLTFLLLHGFVRYSRLGSARVGAPRRREKLALGLLAFLVGEIGMALLFVPLNAFYQAALLFLSTVIGTEMMVDRLEERLDHDRILVRFSLFFIFVVCILAANQWGL